MAKKATGMRAIANDIRRRFNSAVAEFAEEVAFEIEKSYESVIEQFYDDYDPLYYVRGFHLYYGSNGFESPFSDEVVQKFGDSYFAGIAVSSSYIPGDPYRAYKGYVFDRAFYKGIHGINRSDLIRINKNKIGGNELRVSTPKNMKPAPKTLMEREFKRLTKKRNMDAMFQPILERNLSGI